MKEHYMGLIWGVIGKKENQRLSVKEQQDKIVEILTLMEKDVKDFTKAELKQKYTKAIQNALKEV